MGDVIIFFFERDIIFNLDWRILEGTKWASDISEGVAYAQHTCYPAPLCIAADQLFL